MKCLDFMQKNINTGNFMKDWYFFLSLLFFLHFFLWLALASDFWLLASGFWLRTSGSWLRTSGFWLLASSGFRLLHGFVVYVITCFISFLFRP